jgi:membrane protein EpsK
LGISVYGIVPLANWVIPYMSILTGGLNAAISRFLAIDLNREDEAAANRTFNTALAGSVGVVAALLPVGLTLAWLFPMLFRVPPGLENETRLLFGCVLLTFFLTTIGSNFAVSTLILHRFDLRNLVKGLTMATRVGLVVLLFTLLPERLWYVGAGFVVSAIGSFAGDWLWWRKLTPQLCVRLSAFDRARLGELLGMSGWTVVNRVGTLLFERVNLLVVNVYFGAEATGQYGTVVLFSILIYTLAETGASVLSPAIVGRYALQDFEGMRRLVSRAVKLMGIALALPIGLLCGFSRPLLNIWLGPDFQNLNILLIVLVGHLGINLATRPLTYVLTSYNKVRVQGIVTLILGVVNLGLAITLARWGVWGAVGVAAVSAIVLTVKNLFFLSGYSAHVMHLRWWTFYPTLVAGAVGTLAVGLGGYSLTQIWWPDNWFGLGGMVIAVSLGYGVIAYLVSLNREDRQILSSLIREPIRKVFELGRGGWFRG